MLKHSRQPDPINWGTIEGLPEMASSSEGFWLRQNAIMRAVGITSSQQLVLYALNSFIGNNAVCWPAVATLCEATALSRTAVKKALGLSRRPWVAVCRLPGMEFRSTESRSPPSRLPTLSPGHLPTTWNRLSHPPSRETTVCPVVKRLPPGRQTTINTQ